MWGFTSKVVRFSCKDGKCISLSRTASPKDVPWSLHWAMKIARAWDPFLASESCPCSPGHRQVPGPLADTLACRPTARGPAGAKCLMVRHLMVRHFMVYFMLYSVNRTLLDST